MKHALICVGHKPPSWVQTGVDEFEKRLKPGLTTRILAPSKAGSATARKQDEAERIAKALPKKSLLVALDENGRGFSSRELAQAYAQWQTEPGELCFLVGGADGLDSRLLSQARATWSLSAMTLPHALVRVFLVEALYRAQSILNHHPYHRD